jgi:hypothetical protein
MRSIFTKLLFLFPAITFLGSCEKLYNLPEEKDYLSSNVNFTNKIFEPIIGRNQVMGGFNADNSTAPLTFEIVHARFGDGRPVTDLFQKVQTYVWIAPYDGLEKSLAEIEAKRKLEEHSLFEIRSSGEFILWGAATNDLLPPRAADSTHFPQNTRYFDLKIKNSGGEALIKDFQVRPWRERPYEPHNDMNIYSGATAPDPLDPTNRAKRDYIRPFLNNVTGVRTEKKLVSNDNQKDAVVYIRPFAGGNGRSLRIKVLNKDSVAINPAVFAETNWEKLVHGFNMRKTEQHVEYDVAYPIPLVEVPTVYAPGATRSHLELKYSRIGFGGVRVLASFGIDFAIYKPGDWEIVFHFKNDDPKFEND